MIGHCTTCGSRTQRQTKSGLCLPCKQVLLARQRICIGCGGYKANERAEMCRACRDASKHRPWVTKGFSPERLALVMQHAGWTPRQLAEASGVPQTVISSWLAGRFPPRRDGLERIARVLAMVPCQPCGGSGWIDPTLPAVQRLMKRLMEAAS